jgi:hypothetical protein
MDCHAAAWSEHTGHFGKGLFGIGDVHEHSLGADGIEGVVQKAEHLRVANLKGYRKVSADGAANGLGDQRFTDVNPSDVTARSNSLSKIKSVGARTATDIQDLSARLKAEAVKDYRFPGDHVCVFVCFVKELKEEGGVAGLVDTGEMRHVFVSHKRCSEISLGASSIPILGRMTGATGFGKAWSPFLGESQPKQPSALWNRRR